MALIKLFAMCHHDEVVLILTWGDLPQTPTVQNEVIKSNAALKNPNTFSGTTIHSTSKAKCSSSL